MTPPNICDTMWCISSFEEFIGSFVRLDNSRLIRLGLEDRESITNLQFTEGERTAYTFVKLFQGTWSSYLMELLSP